MSNNEKQQLVEDADPMRLTQSSTRPPLPAATKRSFLSKIHTRIWTNVRKLLNIRLLILVISTCIVFLILLTTMWLKPTTSTSSLSANWGELEPFRLYQTEQMHNQSLASAVEHQYIQMINKSAEQSGYTLTLNAVTADENRMIIMYTASAASGKKIDGITGLNVLNIATGKRIHRSSARLNGNQDNNHPHIYYGTATIRLDPNQTFPREVAVQFQVLAPPTVKKDSVQSVRSSATLLIHFSLAPQFQKQNTEIIYPNRTIKWNAHELSIARVEISPLEMRVRFIADVPVLGDNANQLWLRPKGMISTVNGESITLKPIGSRLISEDPYTFEHVFYSNLLDDPDSLQLVVKPREASAYQDVHIIKIK